MSFGAIRLTSTAAIGFWIRPVIVTSARVMIPRCDFPIDGGGAAGGGAGLAAGGVVVSSAFFVVAFRGALLLLAQSGSDGGHVWAAAVADRRPQAAVSIQRALCIGGILAPLARKWGSLARPARRGSAWPGDPAPGYARARCPTPRGAP